MWFVAITMIMVGFVGYSIIGIFIPTDDEEPRDE